LTSRFQQPADDPGRGSAVERLRVVTCQRRHHGRVRRVHGRQFQLTEAVFPTITFAPSFPLRRLFGEPSIIRGRKLSYK
jgi:hypothetical protein